MINISQICDLTVWKITGKLNWLPLGCLTCVKHLKLIRPWRNTPKHSKHFGNHILLVFQISPSWFNKLPVSTWHCDLCLFFISSIFICKAVKMINIDQPQWPLCRSAASFMEMKLQLLEKSILPPAPHLQTERCYSRWNWLSIASLSRQVNVKMIDKQLLKAPGNRGRFHTIHHGRFWFMEVPLPNKQNG